MKELTSLKKQVEEWQKINNQYKELTHFVDLVNEDLSLHNELEKEIFNLKKQIEKLEIKHYLNEKYDRNNAILTIHPGAGGTESQDWASMLWRMYTRWAEKQGFKVSVFDLEPGERAGIKNVSLLIEGEYAYGYLKSEKGVHRLVRISPFDANRRRHTSFASVDVMPEIDEEIEIEIKEEDLRIDTFRASGHGGQHVNKTDSAVRIIHIPTGITVTCQNERSQFKNKEIAMKILQSRLFNYYQEIQNKKIEEIRGEKKDIEWGNQIRSYIFQPYSLVKDHRTEYERSDVENVMDGDIQDFIEVFLKSKNEKKSSKRNI
jgi:peptide chain release factor 2